MFYYTGRLLFILLVLVMMVSLREAYSDPAADGEEDVTEYKEYIDLPSSDYLDDLGVVLEMEGIKPTEEELKSVSTKGTKGRVACSRNENNKNNLGVGIPAGSRIVAIRAYMRNVSWAPGNRWCRSDLGSSKFKRCPIGSGECPIGWSKVRNLRIVNRNNGTSISADFHNWRHDNHRWGLIEVDYIE